MFYAQIAFLISLLSHANNNRALSKRPVRDVIASIAWQSILILKKRWMASSTRHDDNQGLKRDLMNEQGP